MKRWDEPANIETDAIADAARTYPLAPVPPGFTPGVMARVRAATLPPRFTLKWIDLALGLFGASMTGALWLMWQGLPNWPGLQNWPGWANDLAASGLPGIDPVEVAIGALGVAAGLVVMGTCLLIALVLLVPRPVVRLERIAR